MIDFVHSLRRIFTAPRAAVVIAGFGGRGASVPAGPGPTTDIAPDDPFLAYLQRMSGAVNIDRLRLDSPALNELRAAGVTTVVALLSQGELVGLLNLGPRLGDRDYSTDERRLLGELGVQAAPAVRVAQLVRQQREEAEARQRIDQELQLARVIQRMLLPKELPDMPGWRVDVLYEPAREVGGDFYDSFNIPDGRIGFVVGDVTDKGVPAALVMATTRGVLRAAAQRLISPGAVLARVNDQLCPNMPPNMFATCLYLVLEPASGRLEIANAGHNLPYLSGPDGVREIRATGMPLGLMQGMEYEEMKAEIGLDETLLLFSDGLVEAHNPRREMFGFPRLKEYFARNSTAERLVDSLMSELRSFTGPGWEQEDDVTLVVLRREDVPQTRGAGSAFADHEAFEVLADFCVPSEPGNERVAISEVTAAVSSLDLPKRKLEALGTAVGEAAMNAMEHGNQFRAELPIEIKVFASKMEITVSITDSGSQPFPDFETPDLEAKLKGKQGPRGWGWYLMKNLVDDVRMTSDENHHTVELVLRREGGRDDR